MVSWSTVGWFVVRAFISTAISYGISRLTASDGPDVEGPRVDEMALMDSKYGEPIPIIYGSMRVAGNVIWSTGLKEHKHVEEVGGGKGGGGDGGTKTTYTYTCSFALGICEGPIAGINRIWMDGKLFKPNIVEMSPVMQSLYQAVAPKLEGGGGSLGNIASMSIYTGTETQEPDPVMEAEEGSGNVPAYRGLSYIVFEELQLGDYGNRIPNIEVEVAVGLSNQDLIVDMPNKIYDIIYQNGMIITHEDRYAHDDSEAFHVYDSNLNEISVIPASIISRSIHSMSNGKDDDTFLVSTSDGITEINMVDGKITTSWPISAGPYDGLAYSDYIQGTSGILAVGIDNTIVGFYAYGIDVQQHVWPSLLVDKGTTSSTIHSMVIYNGKVLAVIDVNHKYIGIYSNNSVPYPEQTIGPFNIYIDTFTIINGNLVISDNYKLYFYQGISTTPQQEYSFDTGSAGAQSIDTIAGDLLSRAGLDATDYDVSDLSNQDVIGFAVTKPMAVKDAIKPLVQAYQFDVIEAGEQIRCVTRGQSLERSFVEDELAAHEQGSDVPAAVEITRSQEDTLPTKVTIKYKDQNAAYQTAVQYAERITQGFDNHKTVELPIVTTADHALQTAEKLLGTAWAERSKYSIQTLPENIDLLPGSSIDVAGYRMHIEEITTKLPSIIEIKGSSEEPSSYISNAVAAQPSVPDQTIPGFIPSTYSIMMDLPGLNRGYSTPGFFIAPHTLGSGTNWRGAVAYETNDDGDTWISMDAVTTQTLVAKINSAPGTGPVTRWDHMNSLTITPINGRSDLLLSASELSVLAGSNTAALGVSGGEWEIISYTDVIDNGDGTYTLSGLLRGRQGTEDAVSATKTLFVLLKQDTLIFASVNVADLGNNKDYKIVSIGESLTNKSIKSHTSQGDTLKPWSPVHIKGVRNANGDLTITWFRRSRAEGSWNYGDVPMLESSESYEADIMDGNGNVLRTLTVSGTDSDQTGVTYTANDQTTDFGSAQSSVTVKIYQISDVVNRGFSGDATV